MLFRVSLLIIIACISIFFKVIDRDKSLAPATGHELTDITTYFQGSSLTLETIFPLNQEGSFQSYLYKSTQCDGGILVSPMYRNSEGVDLFERKAVIKGYDMGRIFFMLNHKTYQTFPDIIFWITQKQRALSGILGFKHSNALPVLAMRYFGDCAQNLAR